MWHDVTIVALPPIGVNSTYLRQMCDNRCINAIVVVAYYVIIFGDTFDAGVDVDVSVSSVFKQFRLHTTLIQRLSTIIIDQTPT